jgi:hypothetical protein
MADTDLDTLENAAATVMEIDGRYRAASIDDKIDLKPKRDETFTAYSNARLKLLEDGTITTADDVAKMRELRAAVEKAAQTQDLIIAAGRVAIFLAKLALK